VSTDANDDRSITLYDCTIYTAVQINVKFSLHITKHNS
jgi:hypothetical protein